MIVDYLTATFGESDEVFLPGLTRKIDPGAVKLDTRHGYAEDWALWGTGRLKWEHKGEMLARLSLPGSALALHRENGGTVDELIIMIGEAGGHFTRVDLAFDWEMEASSVIGKMVDSIRKGEYTSRWQLENARSCVRTRSLCAPGDTLYLGSPQSDCRLRVYDKAAEQGVEGPWLRAEFQVRKERADAAICLLTVTDEEAVDYVKSLILGYIDIKEPHESDTNKRRWPTADWWAEMWGRQKGCIALGSEVVTEDRARAWIERLGPSIAALIELDGGDLGWLLDAIKEGRLPADQGGRWRAVHQAKLKAWKKARAATG